jgi:hypothetical protein
MRGCETCSGLVYVGDAFCVTCGAEVEKVRGGAGQVTIPVRRHGVAPPPPGMAAAVPDREERQLSAALVLLFSLISAGWVGAALYWLL